MEKKLAIILVIVLAFSCLLPACSDNSKTTSSTTTLGEGSTVSSTEASSDSTVLVESSDTATVANTTGVATTKPGNNTTTTKPTTTKPASGGSSSGTTSAPKPTAKPKPGTNTVTFVDTVETNPVAIYQKAAKEIHDKGVAGYTKKTWQSMSSDVQIAGNETLSSTVSTIIKGLMVSEADAVETVYAKNSSEAKSNMPISNTANMYINLAKTKKSGSNYIVEIYLKDQTDPGKSDVQGLNLMSTDLIYRDDLSKQILNDETGKNTITKINRGNLNYRNYKIVATMTSAGKFVDIKHYTDVHVNANITSVEDSANYDLTYKFNINAHYYNFKY